MQGRRNAVEGRLTSPTHPSPPHVSCEANGGRCVYVYCLTIFSGKIISPCGEHVVSIIVCLGWYVSNVFFAETSQRHNETPGLKATVLTGKSSEQFMNHQPRCGRLKIAMATQNGVPMSPQKPSMSCAVVLWLCSISYTITNMTLDVQPSQYNIISVW